MKKPTFKRVLAYIIDIMIITVIATAISNIKFLNPTDEKYTQTYNEYMEYLQNDLDASEASNIFASEWYQKFNYDLNYYGRFATLITLIVKTLYFVVFQYFTKGYTAGKKIFKIKVEAVNGELKFHHVLIRCLIANAILTSFITLVAVFTLNQSTFANVSNFVEIFGLGLLFVTFGMVIIRDDGRGLHDLIAGTRVVNDK